MKRFAARVVVALLCLSFLPVAFSQWTRTEVAGRSVCIDPDGKTFTPSYEGRSTVTVACNVLTQIETWLGGSLAEAQLALIMPPTTPPPTTPPSLPMGWQILPIGTGLGTAVLSYDTGDWTIVDTGGVVFGNLDQTTVFDVTAGVSADMTLTACVTAADIDGTPVSAKPFVMVRESTAANSQNFHIGIRGASGRRVYRRATTSGSTETIAQDITATVLPLCLRVSVDADNETARAEQSFNGTDYTQLGVDQAFSWLGGTFRAQIGCTANNDADPTATNTCVFDSVVFSLAAVDHDATTVSDIPPFADERMAGVTLEGGRTTVDVDTSAEWQTAMNSAACKTTIQLAPGTYDGNKSITKVCSAAQAIIIKGAANHTSVYQRNASTGGTFTFEGQHNIIDGLKVGTGAIIMAGGTGNRILRHEQTGWGIPSAIRIMPGDGLEIAYCYMHEPGAYTWSSGQPAEFRMGIKMYTPGGLVSSLHKNVWIHHCHFDDFPERPGGNGNFNSGSSDAIEACVANYSWTPNEQGDLNWHIEDNLFTDHKQGDQVIDLKCGGNVLRRNTIKDGPANRVDFRLGSRNRADSNYFAVAGFGVRGAFHRLACNYVRGSQSARGIQINAGNLDAQDTSDINGNPRAEDVLVAENDADKLSVGFVVSTNPVSSLQAQRTQIEDHTGTITDLGTDTNEEMTSDVNCESPVELDDTDVGPDKFDDAPAAYKAAREP
jgi:hypothetical protein